MSKEKAQNVKCEILAKAVGRRKEAVAQVQIIKGTGLFIINEKPAQIYLQNHSCSILAIKAPFEALQNVFSPENLEFPTEGILSTIDTLVKVEGGGLLGQAEAVKLGVARALCQLESYSDNSIRKALKSKGYLTSDARVKERRKYGLKKARKASQYHKR
nr:ribosomal protein S9 [Microspora sp. UTEX LB472]